MNQFKFFIGHTNTIVFDRRTFVFLRGYMSDTNILLDTIGYATASLTDNLIYADNHNNTGFNSNNEMARWYAENRHVDNRVERLTAILDLRRNEITERLRELDGRIRLFQATEVVTVNPTPWTKFKIFGTRVKLFFKEVWTYEPIGLIFVTLLMCVISFIGIMKLLGY